MRKGLLTNRYEVHLPIAVRAPGHTVAAGVTDFMSSRDVRFRLEKPHTITRGTTRPSGWKLACRVHDGKSSSDSRARSSIENVEHAARGEAPTARPSPPPVTQPLRG